jgi:exopolysaccharide biosynthesis protein
MPASRKIKKQKQINPLLITILVCLSLGVTLFLVANRFWFPHEEEIPSQPVITLSSIPPVVPTPIPTPNITQEVVAVTPDPTPTPEPTPEPTPPPVLPGPYYLEYEDEGVRILITRNQTGSGQDQVVSFVADILLTDTKRLQTLFAKDKFGKNISERPSSMAKRAEAILAINGDYYGFKNDGIIIRNGLLYRDEPARDGAAFLQDGTMIVYDERETSSTELLEQGAFNSFSFGPILVKDSLINPEFPPGVRGLNPRTSIGMIAPNHFVFMVVDGRLKGYSKGMTMSEQAEYFVSLGCECAYNLDGGGTSTMVFQGELTNMPMGKTAERASSEIIYIAPMNSEEESD